MTWGGVVNLVTGISYLGEMKKSTVEIEKRIPGNDSEADNLLDKFENEFSKLKHNWNKTLLN